MINNDLQRAPHLRRRLPKRAAEAVGEVAMTREAQVERHLQQVGARLGDAFERGAQAELIAVPVQ